MSERRSIIDLHLRVLAGLEAGSPEEAERVVATHFLARARARTRRRIAPYLRVRVDGSDIAVAAVGSALRCARRHEVGGRRGAMTEVTFAKRLGQIVAGKVAGEVRRARAAKRSVGRDAPLVSDGWAADPAPGPDEVVAGREMFEMALAAVARRIDASKDDTDRLVLTLGLVEGLSGSRIEAEIFERLRSDPGCGLRRLKKRAIQMRLAVVCDELRRELRDSEAGTTPAGGGGG